MSEMLVEVHVNFGDAGEASRVSRAAVERRLAACANLHGTIRSFYWWKGAIEETDETAVVFKTAEGSVDALIDFIAGAHSYEVPGIIVHRPLTANAPYLDWVRRETREA
jgi:periplasmic divalent cation tolerance protein